MEIRWPKPSTPRTSSSTGGPLLGHRWVSEDGEPLNQGQTRSELHRLEAVLHGLDLIVTDHCTWSAGPSALSLLPLVTRLAHLWSDPPTT